MSKKQKKKSDNPTRTKEVVAKTVVADDGHKLAKFKNGSPKKRNKIKREAYEKELEHLQTELVELQEWIKYKGLKVVVIFEGRDTAGKRGTISSPMAGRSIA